MHCSKNVFGSPSPTSPSPSPAQYCYDKLLDMPGRPSNPGYVLYPHKYGSSGCPDGRSITEDGFKKLCRSNGYVPPMGVKLWTQNGRAYPQQANSMGDAGMLCTAYINVYPWASSTSGSGSS